MQLRSASKLGVILALLGAAAAIVIAAAVAWADFEALSYFNTGAGYESFDGLECPSVISLTERAPIRAVFNNPADRPIEPNYRVDISGRTGSRRLAGSVTIPPHGRQEASWTVSADDVDLGFFVLTQLTVLPVAANPTRGATCGILALDTGGATGRGALTLAVAISALLSFSGLVAPALLLPAHEQRRLDVEASTPSRRAQQALGIVSAAALLPALGGAWLGAWLLCVLGLLLLLIVLRDVFV
jgi:hypothetical protein